MSNQSSLDGSPVKRINGMNYRGHALIAVLLINAFYPSSALAHVTEDVAGGLISGVLHPLSGLDHVLAMIAVGLWGAQLSSPAIWILPVTFPLVMAFGGMLGVAGFGLPAVEAGIAVSAIVLGAMVALSVRPPLWIAAILVGVFAIFHGYAHGVELPQSAGPLAYSVGFVFATGCLHATGIAIGTVIRWPVGERLVRFGGAGISCAGLYFLGSLFM